MLRSVRDAHNFPECFGFDTLAGTIVCMYRFWAYIRALEHCTVPQAFSFAQNFEIIRISGQSLGGTRKKTEF